MNHVITAAEELASAAANTIHDQVLEALREAGDLPAIIDTAATRTRSRFDLRADVHGLARQLLTALHGPVPAWPARHTGRLIAVLCEKGYHQALATLSVMSSGHAYLPLHVDWPLERIQSVLGEGRVACILVSANVARDRALCEQLSKRQRVLVIEDMLSGSEPDPFEGMSSLPAVSPDDLAYVIFTSGSTGRPKGVAISHSGALNTMLAVNARFGVSSADKVLALSELSFDLSVYDIFGVLIAGGVVVFPDQAKTKDAGHWLDLIERHRITIWNTVPQLAGLLAEELTQRSLVNRSLRLFLLSGDKIPLRLPDALNACCSQPVIFSLGGATEGSIWSIWFDISRPDEAWRTIPYGHAMPHQSIHVLDEDGRPCGAGEVGEIHIGGAGVAICYWGDEEKTRQSFFTHPDFGRLYRTGDLGVLTEQGHVDFSGRLDRQVKIRGYRVELGDIEYRLSTWQGIGQCVVADLFSLARDGTREAGNRLIAYLALNGVDAPPLDEEALKRYLGEHLPDYMVPDMYVQLAQLPLTANGKVDFASLPLPAHQASGTMSAPRSRMEARVRETWALVLELDAESIGMDDEFIQLGGDSIDAIRLASRLRQNVQKAVSAADIFECRTPRRLCLLMQKQAMARQTPVLTESGCVVGDAALLPVQQWFFERRFERPGQWSQAFYVRTPDLDVGRLRDAVRQLASHHDALRLTFDVNEDGSCRGQTYQAQCDSRFFNVRPHDGQVDEARLLGEHQRTFDLATGPLWGVEYIHAYPDGSARVCFLIHHLLVDTVSWRILAEDLEQLYSGKTLPAKGTSYRQWVQGMQRHANQQANQAAYWQEVLRDHRDPFERSDASHDTRVRQHFALSAEDSTHLLQLANHVFGTEINDLLLAALACAMKDSLGADVHHIMLEGHGREEVAPDLDVSRTMGWFTSLFPVRLQAQDSLDRTIRCTKDMLRAVPGKGVAFGALMGYAKGALPRICFNYLGQMDRPVLDDEVDAAWRLTPESIVLLSAPENDDGYLIIVTGSVLGGVMRFDIDSRLGELAAQGLADALRQRLQEVVSYTSAQQRSYLTPHDVDGVVSAEQLDAIQSGAEVAQVFPANSLQQGFVYHALSQGDTDTAYQVQTIWRYDSAIDEDKLRSAWETAQRIYGALRMRFAWQDGIVQIIDRSATLNWASTDIGELEEAAQRAWIEELIDKDRQQRFKLDEAGLFRLHVVKQGPSKFALLFSCHHAILDGWSSLLLINRAHEIYLDLLDGVHQVHAEDTSYQQAQTLVRQTSADHGTYWDSVLENVPIQNRLGMLAKAGHGELIDLKTYKYVEKPGIAHHAYASDRFSGIKAFCAEQGITVNALFEFICHQLLYIHSHEAITVTGATVSGRDAPVEGIDDAVGLLINTLPVVVRHDEIQGVSVGEALRALQQQMNAANARSATYLANLQKEGRRIFDLLFVHNNFSALSAPARFDRLGIHDLSTVEKLDYPLAMIVEESRLDLVVTIRYAAELFDERLILGFFEVMDRLLKQILSLPDARVGQLRHGQACAPLPAAQTWPSIVAEFARVAESQPHAVALIHTRETLSYGELDSRSNRLAARLSRRHGPLAGALVPVCIADPMREVIAMLAILKLGGAYVPMATGIGQEQASFTLKDTSAPLILSERGAGERLAAALPSFDGIVLVDALMEEGDGEEEPAHPPDAPVTSADLCCVMYTSGSTGQPKGVMIEHAGVVSLVTRPGCVEVDGRDVFIHLADRRFDASLFEIWGALLNGSQLVLVDDPLEVFGSASRLHTLLSRHGVSVLWLTKSIFDELCRQDETVFAGIRCLLVGGEALNKALIEKLLASGKAPSHVLNGYGPTENTTFSTVCELTPDRLSGSRSVPIGQALPHRHAIVLGPHGQEVPAHAIGELYVGGAGLSRGYLGKPELTRQAFIFHEGRQSRFYRTGDLAVLSEQGDLVFMGRADAQVKLRGYRIELEEVEIALCRFAGIEGACAAIKTGESGHKRLVGYYVAEAGVDEEALRQHMAASCPDYMVPSRFVHMKDMPLTSSGKVDRARLPDPASLAVVSGDQAPMGEQHLALRRIWSEVLSVAPESIGPDADFFALGGDSILCLQMVGALNKSFKKSVPVRMVFKHKTLSALLRHVQEMAPADHVKVRKIWAEVLSLPETSIGFEDDFFAIGGDSILCLQMVNRLNKTLACKVPVRIVFKHKTIAALIDHVHKTRAASAPSSLPAEAPAAADEALALHPIQKWFFALKVPHPNHWNQAFLIRTPALEFARLERAVNALFQQHDVFSLVYKPDEADALSPRQIRTSQRRDRAVVAIDVAALSEQALQERLTDLQSGFDLENGPLYAAAYLHGHADGSARVFMAFHHLIMDAVSWRILMQDLEMLYAGETLAPVTASYAQWGQALVQYGLDHSGERAYWRQVLGDYTPALHESLAGAGLEGMPRRHRVVFDADSTSALLHKCHHAYNTEISDLLVTALGKALQGVTRRTVNHIVIEGHGREHIDDRIDLGRTIGWFTILRPLRISVSDDVGDTIQAVKESLREAPHKGIGYGAIHGYDPLVMPAISFNYLGQFNESRSDGWHISQELAGSSFHQANATRNVIDINCHVSGGQLVMMVDAALDAARTQSFLADLTAFLYEVVDHCVQKRDTTYTRSDFRHIRSEADIGLLPAITSGDPHGWFEMTEIQKAYLVGRLGHFEIGNVSNHIYYEYTFGSLDADRMERALNTLIRQEPVLRTVFSFETLKQRMLSLDEFGYLAVRVNDLSGLQDASAAEARLDEVRERLSHFVYDPEKAPLFTFEVSRLADRCCLHISMDLILLDAESRRKLLARLDSLYRLGGQDDQETVGDARAVTSFKQYQAAYQALRSSAWYEQDKAYWHDRIDGLPLRPELPLKRSPSEVRRPVFCDHTLYIEPDTWQRFKARAAKHDVSPSAALLSLYGEVIGFHAGATEFIMTMTVFNRYPLFGDVERIMGDFTSTNLFHFQSIKGVPAETIRRTHAVMWDNIAHSLYTGLEVQRDLVQRRGLDIHKATSPIVFTGVLGNKNSSHEDSSFLEDTEDKERRTWTGQTSQAWIDLQAIETEGRFMSKWLYVDQLFDRDYIAQLNEAYCRLITQLADEDWEGPDACVLSLSAPGADATIAALGEGESQHFAPGTLFDLLGRSDGPAVIEADGQVTSHGALADQARALASHLASDGGQHDAAPAHAGQLIAVLSEKGLTQVTAVLAAMMSGHGYLPLHVEWPVPRLTAVLAEGRVRRILVSRAQSLDAARMASLTEAGCELVVVEDVLARIDADTALARALDKVRLPKVEPDDIAYVIFTSGSTGTPKGVTISHRGALNTVHAVNRRLDVGQHDRILALSELSFDLSVYDMFGLLMAGGAMVFPSQDSTKDSAHWLGLVDEHRITLWNSVPQLARLLLEERQGRGGQCGASLRAILMSGDRIPIELPPQLRSAFPKAEIMSLGGATEGSIWSVWHDLTETDPAWPSVPYGRAMPNQKMLVLNGHGDACPVGVMGEIHIGGQGVALNYWGDQVKTAASFIRHEREGRLYRTGDIGRWSPDGWIEFIGRKDSQVKLRGYRVELGEIEASLRRLPGVDEVVVSASAESDAGRSLTAFLRSDRLGKLAADKHDFKLAQHGDRPLDGLPSIDLPWPQGDADGLGQIARKSYRVFDGEPLEGRRLVSALSKPRKQSGPAAGGTDGEPGLAWLGACLHGLMAVDGEDEGTLPKYRYPSAGNLYPVQVYVRVNGGHLPGLPSGDYCYDRRGHRLARVGERFATDRPSGVEIHLVGLTSAIRPLYGSASDFLIQLECGYMEGVLDEVASDAGWCWAGTDAGSTEHLSKAFGLSPAHMVVRRLIPSRSALREPALAYVYVRPGMVAGVAPGWHAHDAHGLRALPWPLLPELDAVDDNALIWSGAAFAVFFVSEGAQASPVEYVKAGTVTQTMMEAMLDADVGSCAMGEVHPGHRAALEALFPGRVVMHHFAAGPIMAAHKRARHALSLDRQAGLAAHIDRKLREALPAYMVPDRLVFLDSFPLSANGKVDLGRLESMAQAGRDPVQAHVPPSTEVERVVADMWADLLAIPLERISVDDTFFRLGGNSLLAMQFIGRFNRRFGCQLRLDRFYESSDVRAVAGAAAERQEPMVERVTGEL